MKRFPTRKEIIVAAQKGECGTKWYTDVPTEAQRKVSRYATVFTGVYHPADRLPIWTYVAVY